MVLIANDVIRKWHHNGIGWSFRPLAGIMVLIADAVSASNSSILIVSVPLRGLWFLSISSEIESLKYNYRFRPLAGIMVLIRKRCRNKGLKSPKVSVPLRGLWFLSQFKLQIG